MVSLAVDKADLVVTVRMPHAPLVAHARAATTDAATFLQWEAFAAAQRELTLAERAMQISDAQIEDDKLRYVSEMEALKSARATVTGVAELVQAEAQPK